MINPTVVAPGMLMMVQPLRDAIHAAKQAVTGKDESHLSLSWVETRPTRS